MPGLGDSVPVLIALTAGLFAPLSGWAARFRSRSAAIWFLLGAFSGPIALLLLAASPPARCPDCDRVVPGWDRSCTRCGATFPPFWAEAEPTPPVRPVPEPDSAIAPARSAVAEPVAEPSTGSSTTRRNGRHRTRIEPAAQPTPVMEAASTMPAVPEPERAWASPIATAPPAERSAAGTPPTEALPVEPTPPVAPVPAVSAAPPVRAMPSSPDAPGEMRVLSTGIYVLGNGGLEIGARYALALAGDRLRIIGPVDLGEVTVRHERPTAQLEVTAVGDQLIISATHSGNLSMVFQRLGGMPAAELERLLAPAVPGGGSASVLRT